jgi:hypothetical protein
VHALALRAEEAEDLGRLLAGAAEPVGHAGIELRDLAGAEHEIVLVEDQSHPPRQHVQPLVSVVHLSGRPGTIES